MENEGITYCNEINEEIIRPQRGVELEPIRSHERMRAECDDADKDRPISQGVWCTRFHKVCPTVHELTRYERDVVKSSGNSTDQSPTYQEKTPQVPTNIYKQPPRQMVPDDHDDAGKLPLMPHSKTVEIPHLRDIKNLRDL